jgi:Flp pilus assembly protein TadG
VTAVPSGHSDRGSAVVEFVLVGVLVIALFLGVLYVGVILHVKNVLTAAASDGARYGAHADRNLEEGAEVTRQLITTALRPEYAEDVQGSYATDPSTGLRTVEVMVRASIPMMGFLGPRRVLVVQGRALSEHQ